MIAEAFENTTDNAVAALVNLDASLIAVGFGGVAYGIGVDRTILKLDTVGDTLHIVLGYIAVAPYVVYFFLDKLRMRELGCKIAVVGEKEHAGGVAVETADRIDAFVASTFHQIHHSETSIGVVACGNAIFRLVEQDVAFTLHGHYLFIVFHYIAVGDFGAEFCHDLAVDFHQTLLDEFVGLTTRAYAGIAHIFVETYLFVGIGYRHFVFYRLGTRSETLATSGERTTLLTLLVAALTLLIATLLTLLVAALTLLIATLLALLVSTLLALLIAALLTLLIATLALLIAALLTGLITALTLLVAALLTGLIGTGLICRTLLAFCRVAFGLFIVGALCARLVWTLLVATLTLLIAAVVIIVSVLIAVVITALLTGLIRTFGTVLSIFGTFGTLIARTLFRGLTFRHTISLPYARAFGFLLIRIRFHNSVLF